MKRKHYAVDLGMMFNKRSANLLVKTGYFLLVMMILGSGYINAQQILKVGEGSGTKEVLILPLSYDVDRGFDNIGKVKTGKLPHNHNTGFMAQLEKVAAMTVSKGGNVFQIERVADRKQLGKYRFWGEAYHTNDLGKLREKYLDKEKKKFENGTCAYITVYRPAYSGGFNDDSVNYIVIVNDTLKLQMQPDSRYVLKVAKEGNVVIEVNQKNFRQKVNVDVKMGHDYYIRSYVNIPGSGKYVNATDVNIRLRGYAPYLEKTDEQQGAIESSMVTKIIVSKKI